MTRLLTLVLALGLISGCGKAPEAPRKPTAQANVQVLEQEFVIAGLDRSRTIRLYLPPDYESDTEYYPVIYMHDGQNLFDDATSYAGEWKVDESLNLIAQQTGKKFIVVGIDNGQEYRMNELSPWANDDFLPAEGDAYLAFITDILKPYIDTHYRTQGGRNHTAIMGSSMGGLMTHYAMYKRPDIFSKAGIYSPSYWFSKQSFAFTQQHPLPNSARMDFIVGEKEGGSMVQDMLSMTALIEQQKRADVAIRQKVVADAQHNEAFWAEHFGQTILWLFSE